MGPIVGLYHVTRLLGAKKIEDPSKTELVSLGARTTGIHGSEISKIFLLGLLHRGILLLLPRRVVAR